MATDPKRIPYERSASSGAVVYPRNEYRRNHVIWPGTEKALDDFVNQKHHNRALKFGFAHSSNSEDALTWSCFNTLREVDAQARAIALEELWWMAFGGMHAPPGVLSGKICIGKTYRVGEGKSKEETEVDVSIESADALVFIEAKLYSRASLADEKNKKPHDQLARKLRIGVKEALLRSAGFYFIVLDIAPNEILQGLKKGKARSGFASKWLTADLFAQYKGSSGNVKPLEKLLADIPGSNAKSVAQGMGWLSWPDVYKAVLRAVIPAGVRA